MTAALKSIDSPEAVNAACSAMCSDCFFWSWDDESRSGGHCHAFNKDGTWQSKACPLFAAKIAGSNSQQNQH
jgi:hypothetical protein